jgi:hypothetical protein
MLRLLRSGREAEGARTHRADPLRAIASAAARGDRTAQRTLLLETGSALLRTVLAVLGGASPDLEDVFQEAMTAASIPQLDAQSGRPRKPLHSLRATFTRRMLERGRHPQWVEAQLGHSSLQLTIGVYGAWTAEAMRAEAGKE